MRPEAKAGLWLGATFIVGIALGMVLNGALAARAATHPSQATGEMRLPANRDNPPGPPGFVAEMERVIQPRDDAQRNQLRPFFEATDRSNRIIVDGARIAMATALDSLRTAVAPLLDEAQRKRLAEFSGPPNNESAPGMGGRGMPGEGRGRGRGTGRGPDDVPGGPPPSRPPNSPPLSGPQPIGLPRGGPPG